jgi:hypothetical protein
MNQISMKSNTAANCTPENIYFWIQFWSIDRSPDIYFEIQDLQESWYPWKQFRRFLSFEFSLSNKTLAISIEQVRYPQTSPPITVDGVLDQKPSKVRVSGIHLTSFFIWTQHKRSLLQQALNRRSVLHKAMLIHRYQILQVVVHSPIKQPKKLSVPADKLSQRFSHCRCHNYKLISQTFSRRYRWWGNFCTD